MSETEHQYPQCPGCGERHPPKAVILVEGAELPPHMEKLAAMFGGKAGAPAPHQVGGVGGLLDAIFGGGPRPPAPNTKSAWLREPMYTKSRPLTAKVFTSRFQAEGKRAHHKVCRYVGRPVRFLDYVECSKCNVSLGEADVFWQRVGGKK
jgi:hypothetical protein